MHCHHTAMAIAMLRVIGLHRGWQCMLRIAIITPAKNTSAVEYVYVITAANEMTAPSVIDTVVTDPNKQGQLLQAMKLCYCIYFITETRANYNMP